MKVVAFLQNAWSPVYAGCRWPRASWLEALWRSRSGQRLSHLIDAAGKDTQWWFDNTTEEVGGDPDSVCVPNYAHIQRVLRRENAKLIVALGRQADEALKSLSLDVPVLGLPHPACRILTNKLLVYAGGLISDGLAESVSLKQGRKSVLRTQHGKTTQVKL